MPYLYEQSKNKFNGPEHFKEVAIKTVNEIYGRVKPVEIFDFSETKSSYRAVAYRDGEDLPAERKAGDALGHEQEKAVEDAKNKEKETLLNVAGEIISERGRLWNLIDQGGDFSDEDMILAKKLGVLDEDGVPVEPKAHKDAQALADEHGIDLRFVDPTGKKGYIVKADVANHLEVLKANDAPEEENADEDGEQQPGE